MKLDIYKIVVLFILFGCVVVGNAQTSFGNLDPSTSLSVLTCSPGDELYSTFGHTAIRIHGELNGKRIDRVYNYGTFNAFEDNFYMKFARGKLNYALAVEKFHEFQYTYMREERGIVEQVLNLSPVEVQYAFELLEKNALPENREYLYDFFYNNCSTKVRDVLLEASQGKIQYKDLNDGETTFRDAIQLYLGNQPWGDLGIDLALGLPCDKIMTKSEDMFLPDFLFDNLAVAAIDGQPLVQKTQELVMLEVEPSPIPSEGPSFIFYLTSIPLIAILLSLFLMKKIMLFNLLSKGIFFIFGLLGLFILLLWIATDHSATANNMNLFWASPLFLVLLGFWKKEKRRMSLLYFHAISLICIMVFWRVLPQDLHAAILPFIILLLGVSVMNIVLIYRKSKIDL